VKIGKKQPLLDVSGGTPQSKSRNSRYNLRSTSSQLTEHLRQSQHTPVELTEHLKQTQHPTIKLTEHLSPLHRTISPTDEIHWSNALTSRTTHSRTTHGTPQPKSRNTSFKLTEHLSPTHDTVRSNSRNTSF
jgi:hypothetical protein